MGAGVAWVVLVLANVASAQTVAQSETSIGYLRKTTCMDVTGASPVVVGGACLHDDDCSAPATCEHRSLVTPATDLFVPLEFPPTPSGGAGPGVARYVPLCEDGSGDHDYSMSGGLLGRAPTCAPQDYIRCADGTRPYFHFAQGTRNDWMFYAGEGGEAQSPDDPEVAWQRALYGDHVGKYTAPTPNLLRDFTGYFRSELINPFHDWNRVWVTRCAPDTFAGNRDYPAMDDALVDLGYQQVVGACTDVDASTYADCDDNLTVPGSCACSTTVIAPPESPDHTYAMYYHGRRIVRAVVADAVRGMVGRVDYPLVDDGTGHAAVQPNDVVGVRPTRSSKFVFTCHSSGCRGLESGLLDDLHDLLDTTFGAPMNVWAIFNKALYVSYEVEAAVSEWDGTDVDGDGFADTPAVIDDNVSVYDHIVDTVSSSGEPMSTQAWEPGGGVAASKSDWYDPSRPGHLPIVDASCRQFHCPNAVDPSTDPACTPCNSADHIMLNHMQTPFVLIGAQTDGQNRALARQCVDQYGDTRSCNYDRGPVNLVDSHYRPLVRKQFSDLYRDAVGARCEAAFGPGAYDRVLVLLQDSSWHAGLQDDALATVTLDPQGPIGPTTLVDATAWWIDHVDSAHPRTGLCLQERFPGENAADFGGTVPACQ
ncbi:MAG: hypothetical protein H6738_18300 [Alphaproteobacteria bacterium]|nr:hypothetical protein [Alphaproteobacteria bacterium]